MEEFLNKLYSYEYFGIYLVISILVLILLFIVILFFGKKDQKEREIIATKKLQQINEDAFKDDSIEEKLEVTNEEKLEVTNEEKLENDTIIVPTIDEVPSIMEVSENEIPEPVLPTSEDIQVEEPVEPVMDIPVVEDAPIPTIEPEVEEITPLLDKIEEKPLVFNDFNIEPEEKIVDIKLEAKEAEKEEIEVPTFNFDEIVKSVEETKKEQTYTKGPEIFSSVYVPEKEEVELPKVEESKVKVENDLGFELPTLKKTTPVEEPKEEVITEIKEEKIEMPVLHDYNLDNLSGETYTINK